MIAKAIKKLNLGPGLSVAPADQAEYVRQHGGQFTDTGGYYTDAQIKEQMDFAASPEGQAKREADRQRYMTNPDTGRPWIDANGNPDGWDGIEGAEYPNKGITNGSFDRANEYVMSHLAGLGNNVGTASLMLPRILKNSGKSIIGEFANPTQIDPEDELPLGPGKTYLSHLFKAHGLDKKVREQNQKQSLKAGNIFTDQAEALKAALSVVGVLSDRNPGGLPIEIHEAQKFWFDGKEDIDEIDKASFMSQIEGDNKIDPKRVRKFTNYDGSLTYEIINQDKTVQSRFTMGKFKGKTIFSQGGYKKFAELFKKARAKFGKDDGGEFDAIRTAFRGE